MIYSRWNAFPAAVAFDHAGDNGTRSRRISVATEAWKPHRRYLLDMHLAFPGNVGGIPNDQPRKAALGAPLESVIHGNDLDGLHIALAHAAAEAQAHWKL